MLYLDVRELAMIEIEYDYFCVPFKSPRSIILTVIGIQYLIISLQISLSHLRVCRGVTNGLRSAENVSISIRFLSFCGDPRREYNADLCRMII